ncbi:hypothetical protein PX554_25620 [Sphingomonas sp. H39-1-10]|uniref:hypothetical protein n=1 Tax=Sphingomonas pollutisoli TaxID=3030829 RepID=UPI0023B9B895|nr:hypothetical protein [Sphingomonas pollutisoli]MDF0491501.1 hypothetical protein [Sphingomonas pollutisoli]
MGCPVIRDTGGAQEFRRIPTKIGREAFSHASCVIDAAIDGRLAQMMGKPIELHGIVDSGRLAFATKLVATLFE